MKRKTKVIKVKYKCIEDPCIKRCVKIFLKSNMSYRDLGKRVFKIMKKYVPGLTLNRSYVYMNHLMSGKMKSPDIQKLRVFAKAMKVKITDIIKEE